MSDVVLPFNIGILCRVKKNKGDAIVTPLFATNINIIF